MFKFSGLQAERCCWIRELLVHSGLYAARVDTLNDPMECRFRMVWNATLEELQEFFGDRCAGAEREKAIVGAQTVQGQQEASRQVADLAQKRGIVSLTEDCRDTRLWSYYADKHQGVAVRFDTSPGILQQVDFEACLPVRYQDEFPVVDVYRDPHLDLLQRMHATKALCWQHEREWRLIFKQPGYYRIPDAAIDGLVFGLRTDPEIEREIRSWVDKRKSPIDFLRVENEPNSYNLKIVPA
jgi:hypothetical protein